MEQDNKGHFKRPPGYLDSFNERLFARIQAEDGEPDTSFIPKTDGFGLPEGYLDSLTPAVKAKTTQPQPKLIKLVPSPKWWYAAAAIAVLFVLAINWAQNTNTTINFDTLANTEIEAYLEANELGLSAYEIATIIALEEPGLTDLKTKDLNTDGVLDYLDEHLEDLEDLDLDYEAL